MRSSSIPTTAFCRASAFRGKTISFRFLMASNPGNMAVENVQQFLAIVRNTDGSAEAVSDDFRGKRLELVAFWNGP